MEEVRGSTPLGFADHLGSSACTTGHPWRLWHSPEPALAYLAAAAGRRYAPASVARPPLRAWPTGHARVALHITAEDPTCWPEAQDSQWALARPELLRP